MEIGPDEPSLIARIPSESLRLQKILVPIDFSECSEKALRYAVAFAQQFPASLTFMHVIEINYGVGEAAIIDLEKTRKEMIEDAKRKLSALAREIPKVFRPGIIVETGTPYDEITRAAEQLKMDLVIISTHGRSGLKRFFMGSTTEKVVRHASCPVLVVRDREHDFVDTSKNARKTSRRPVTV